MIVFLVFTCFGVALWALMKGLEKLGAIDCEDFLAKDHQKMQQEDIRSGYTECPPAEPFDLDDEIHQKSLGADGEKGIVTCWESWGLAILIGFIVLAFLPECE